MRTSSLIARLALLAVLTSPLVWAGALRAADPPSYASANQAYRQGLRAYRAGDMASALPALSFAAGEGVLGAQLKLARMYEAGDGLEQNDAKAFQFYQQIADAYAETSPRHPIARHIAGVFVKLGDYHARGIEELKLTSDTVKAAGYYRHAASFFGEPQAQYKLAKLYLLGDGVEKSPRLAVNWLANASKKRHAPSQALLGDLLWRGGQEIRQQPAQGLALLSLARRNANRQERDWIDNLYQSAFAKAGPEARAAAKVIGAKWGRSQIGGFEAPTSLPPVDTANSALTR